MPRSLARALVAAAAALALTTSMGTVIASAAGSSTPAPTVATVAGGGRGLSGPASRALMNSGARLDGAPDGTVVVQDAIHLMRVNPATDTVQVIPWPSATSAFGAGDVAADGGDIVMRLGNQLVRLAPGGAVSVVWNWPVGALDVGSDHVIWTLSGNQVYRIAPGGNPTAVTPVGALAEPTDLTVSPDGSKVFVLDEGSGHRGVYQVTTAGVGARVAGNGGDIGDFRAGLSPTGITTAQVTSISTNGTSLAMSSPYVESVLSFPLAGGALSQVSSGPCSSRITHLGSDLVGECVTAPGESSLHRFSATGTDRGRILGADPQRPWSPDGVRATDAYLDTVHGASGTPDGRVVLTTEHGLVRDVLADGTLHTRATLAPLPVGRGKVALAPDGTAYVTTGTGALTKVTADGVVTTVGVDATVADVEVLADGALAVADAAAHRILRVAADGTATDLISTIDTPVDLARDGDSLLVADGGLRRVSLTDGAVTTVLGGGRPSLVTATGDGVWANPEESWLQGLAVIAPDHSMQRVADLGGTVTQLQAVGDGTVVRGGGDTVSRILTAGVGTPAPALAVTATAGEGRIVLGWGESYRDVEIVAKRGATAPGDLWDGIRLPGTFEGGATVTLIDGTPLVPGEQWSFSVFERGYATLPSGTAPAWGPPSSATAAALPDTTPPGLPTDVSLTADQKQIELGFSAPRDDDLDRVVVRYAVGSTPPATVTDGLEFPRAYPSGWSWGTIPDPVRDQDYAVSIFAVDHQGNVSTWSGVTRLDLVPPGQVTDVSVQPSYRNVGFTFTKPADPDYDSARYAVVPAGATAEFASSAWVGGTALSTPETLTMDTDYVLALWTVDKAWNHSEPVLVPFRTLLDTTPPAAAANLSVQGGAYQVSATWTPATDSDLKSQTAVLTDLDTGKKTNASPIGKTTSSFTWTKQPGGHTFRVEVFATDLNGLTSPVSSAEATTAPDSNGPPPAVPLSSISWTPASTTSVAISFPRPDIPDLKALAYDVRPVGADPDPITTLSSLSVASATVKATVQLPQAITAYELIIYVWDHNGNRVRTIVPSVKGAPNASELPLAPTSLTVTTPRDNTLDVSWAKNAYSVPVTSWRVTATSGTLSRTVTVDGSRLAVQLGDLVGRTAWQVSVVGVGTWGSGATATASSVTVGDKTAPQPVTSAKRVASYDTDTLTWINPKDFDLHHVDVIRRGPAATDGTLIYRGKGTSVRSAGLLAGKAYSYEIRTYDAFGQTWSSFVRLDTQRVAPSIAGSTTVRYGSAAKISGVLRFNGTVLGGRSVTLFVQRYGTTTWTKSTTVTTSSTGAYAFSVKPTSSTRYRVGYVGSGSAGGAYSATASVAVTPTVTMSASRTSLYYGGTVTLSTVVRPGHAGRSISLQRWNGTSWVTVTRRTLSSTSTASATVKPPARGTNKYRWVLPSHTDHGTGTSATASIRVL